MAMEKPKRPRGRPTAESKAKYEADLKEYEEKSSQAFVEQKLSESHQKRKHSLKPDESTLKTIFEFSKLDCTQAEIAAVLHVSEYTFVNFMKSNPIAREAFDDGRQFHRIILRQDQVDLSKKNAAVVIFRGKNTLGQKDESHSTTTINTTVSEMTTERLMEIALGSDNPSAIKALTKMTKH